LRLSETNVDNVNADLSSASTPTERVLQVRWLGRVAYHDALALQRGLFAGTNDHLLLLEHPPTYTMGLRTKAEHLLTDVEAAGAVLAVADRGGDVTYHGPGQLVGYPIVSLPGKRGGGMADTVAYVSAIEQLVIDTLTALGIHGPTVVKGRAGVWLGTEGSSAGGAGLRKIAAIGVRLVKGRTMHGFAINIDRRVEEGFARIVPCGIADATVTSIEAEGVVVSAQTVVDTIVSLLPGRFGMTSVARADEAWRVASTDLSRFTREHAESAAGDGNEVDIPLSPTRGRESARLLGRLAEAGVDASASVAVRERKPEWMRVKADMGPQYRQLKETMRSLDLVTVCEEAGCPNIFDCWNDGTATFMVLGERCTRACGFCLVDTRKPLAADPAEPARVAEAVEKMNLRFAVITMVARDDLPDGGAAHVAATIQAIRDRNPGTQIEALISDHKGVATDLDVVFAARPDVLNHNLETVARLQRAVRPSASYARSLSVLARSKAAGLVTKSGLIAGMGETIDELKEALIDLRSVGVDIVTIGQYLRPTERHLPMARWVTPEEFEDLRVFGMGLGFSHVESSPLTRSSYHARQGAESAGVGPVAVALAARR
jgi:lipoyl synthase